MGIPVLPAIFKRKVMKCQPFKKLNLILCQLNTGMSLQDAFMNQGRYFSRGKGMNNTPRQRSCKHMAIKRASIKAKNIKKYGR